MSSTRSGPQMSEARRYQQLRGHLSYLKLDNAADALPRILDAARSENLSITAALERLLEIEVNATEETSPGLPTAIRLPARSLDPGRLRLRRPTRRRREAHPGPGHPAVPRRRLEHSVGGTSRCWQDHAGHQPGRDGASALFQVINQRYLKSSTILTTNVGIADWATAFGDATVAAAMLDRLLHRATVVGIDGPSYRLRSHQNEATTLRKAVNAHVS
ncbi:ATP-binding protein [Saccharopolyspora shandongensis]|uniref:ATP-binding protein n=1 Tax=Saccharopolyspora shandongensis TaxID=418495 RepID=UPI003F4D0ED0